ncbi:hypothetical protein BGZ63DRAFT_424743 [Mariannaea sp. PMI_226]|nr:hypothetical protein BGZ63DRAFT_424743 [Mariannaea sp. PMI_226]
MPEKQRRRWGRPRKARKVQAEKERLAAQRTHSRRYYRRLQQEDVGSVAYTEFHNIPYGPAPSSAEVQLPDCHIPPNDSALPLSSNAEDPDEQDPLLVGDSTWGLIGLNDHITDCCPSDVDRMDSDASTPSEEIDKTREASPPNLSAEEARSHL